LAQALQIDLGLIPYAEAYALQNRIVTARKLGAIGDVLLFCEHPHVITQGRNGKREHLLVSENVLRQKGVEFFETSRGGDVTYHGPGQIVAYPILNLGAIRRDVVWYVRRLEEAMIRATAEFGIAALREAGKTGIWVGSGATAQIEERFFSPQAERFTASEPEGQKCRLAPLAMTGASGKAEKLGAIGVHISRWVTSHGLAYNVSTDLRNFELIVPCGIADRKATSLEKLLGREVGLNEVRPKLAKHLGEVFELELEEINRTALLENLETVEQPAAATA
jgi:lipoyl(octanoyl) transferase